MHQEITEHAHLKNVADFFDGSSKGYLRFGDGKTRAVRSGVWGPGVQSKEEAAQFIDRIILERLEKNSMGFPSVLDLGCGFGDSLAYLSRRLPMKATGISLSGEQVQQASSAYSHMEHLNFIEANFESLRILNNLPLQHHIFSIDAFAYVYNMRALLKNLFYTMVPGGLLIICDDFLAEEKLSKESHSVVDAMSDEYHHHTLYRASQISKYANVVGFELLETSDLTPWLRWPSARERVMSLALKANLRQRAFELEILSYKFLVLQKPF